jgi:hypothetical protein
VSTDDFTIRDSGTRQQFASGMVRDTATDKVNFLSVRFGPMFRRWATHLTAGRAKYPDPEPGVPNWTLAQGPDELLRAKESAARHFEAWLAGERDEDHAAGVFFNINLAEYVLDKAAGFNGGTGIDPAHGVTADPMIGTQKFSVKVPAQGDIVGDVMLTKAVPPEHDPALESWVGPVPCH